MESNISENKLCDKKLNMNEKIIIKKPRKEIKKWLHFEEVLLIEYLKDERPDMMVSNL